MGGEVEETKLHVQKELGRRLPERRLALDSDKRNWRRWSAARGTYLGSVENGHLNLALEHPVPPAEALSWDAGDLLGSIEQLLPPRPEPDART